MNRALCIGISDYGSPKNNLPGVANDVLEVARLLSGDGGAFATGMQYEVDARATRERILRSLETVFDADPGDTVFVYLAGHGMADSGQYYFVPHGLVDAPPETWAVPLSEVKERFEKCPAERVLLFLDCCHSGGVLARRPRFGAEGSDAETVLGREIRIEGGSGKVVYAACTEAQYAYEDGEHGFFTRAMVEGIRGAAANPAGEVTAGALFDYIAAEVEKARGSLQVPMTQGRMRGRMVLVHDVARAIGAPASAGPLSTSRESDGGRGATAVDDSGALLMLGTDFFEGASVQSSADGLVVKIPSAKASTDGMLEALRGGRPGFVEPTIAYAHRNDGSDVRVVDVTSESTGGEALWTVTLERQLPARNPTAEITYSSGSRTWTALDGAIMTGRRILLGEAPEHERHEPGRGRADWAFDPTMFIDDDGRGLVNECPARELGRGSRENELDTLRRVRLRCMYLLRQLRVIDRIDDFSVGPIDEEGVTLSLQGRRSSIYADQADDPVSIEGVCRFGQ